MRSMTRRVLLVVAVAFILVQLPSCHGFFSGPTLTSISVAPSSPNIAVSQTQQFTASGVNDDGSTSNVNATWTSSDQTVATIDASGLATALKAGSTTITATSTGTPSVSGTTTLTVTTSALTSITVTDTTNGNISMIGLTDQFHATAHFADGSTQDITSTATWTSSNTLIATITSPGGLATGVGSGSTSITASVGNITSAPFTLTVF